MPIVDISLMVGRSADVHGRLIERVTDAVAETLDVDPEKVIVVLREVPREHWASGGRRTAEPPAESVTG
jgi:4-oxalocrotonate tautomerase